MTNEDINELKLNLGNFFDKIPGCEDLSKRILLSSSEKDMLTNFRFYRNDIFEGLGGESIYDLEDEIEELESEVKLLESKLRKIESKLGKIEDKYDQIELKLGNTINDEFKRETFLNYVDDFNPPELELLLKNGKKLLKNI